MIKLTKWLSCENSLSVKCRFILSNQIIKFDFIGNFHSHIVFYWYNHQKGVFKSKLSSMFPGSVDFVFGT